MKFGALILAAGASRRMGRPKLLLPWKSGTVLGHLVQTWRGLGAERIAVVCALGDQAIHTELDRVALPLPCRLINPNPDEGMFSSIQTAARFRAWRTGLTHIAIVLGDQPQISSETLRSILDHAREHSDAIVQPSYQKHPRHPVILPMADFDSLASATEPNLKAFLENRESRRGFLELQDPSLALDIDTPQDYTQALAAVTDNSQTSAAANAGEPPRKKSSKA